MGAWCLSGSRRTNENKLGGCPKFFTTEDTEDHGVKPESQGAGNFADFISGGISAGISGVLKLIPAI